MAPDGSFYVADRDDGRVRFVGTDGLISTVAGGGFEDGADGDRAVDVYLDGPVGLALGPNGDVFMAEQDGNRVRRMRVDGRIFAVAGTGGYGSDGDGGPAVEARIVPSRVAVGAGGSVFISDTFSARIRRISPGGVIRTFAGSGESGDPRTGAPATAVDLSSPAGLALGPDGTLVFADFGANSIWQAGLALRRFSEGDIGIAGESGNQLFVFDDRGRHLRTVHALTGEDILRFRYDADGLLTEIETGDGLITTVQRDAGRPTAVVAPFGQVLELGLGTDGYLETVRNPAGETRTFSYDHLGRLTAFTDRLGRKTTATYDS
ncbi:MAG: hypothetical protein GY856_26990, partial [bacterium]|nr:hypothetical protein [bacterium]